MKRDKESADSTQLTAKCEKKSATPADNNKCKICSKVFTYGNDLRKHLRIHSDERPFPCQAPGCGQRFRQAGCLKNHIASQHGGTDRFSCYYCAKSFPIKERLRLHMRIHSGEKPYTCCRCQRSFSRGGQLKQHMITHSDCRTNNAVVLEPKTPAADQTPKKTSSIKPPTNPNSCAICGMSFVRRLLLKKHILECAKRSGQCSVKSKPKTANSFECNNCDSAFTQQSQPYACNQCPGRLTQNAEDRPYKCQVCWHSFAHSSVLRVHIRKHTGERPFNCAVCVDTSFSQLPHLKTHMRTIHRMDKTYQCAQCNTFYKTKNEQQQHTAVCSAHENRAPRPDTQHTKQQTEKLSQMRLCVAVLLKRISTGERLKQLGFEKVLIDNVIISALKKADQPFESDATMNDLDRLCANVRHFLEWTIPKTILDTIEHKDMNVKDLLDKLTRTNDRS